MQFLIKNSSLSFSSFNKEKSASLKAELSPPNPLYLARISCSSCVA
ncbi:hypothetical protein HF239_001709 [Campylobacter jejuni]|nr:hypothetical protein [Campylobacter helveticus]EEY3086017.1 hypothetical protein [Campylobacter jejuni]MCR2066447.1 hypothetical protein [Campylobacter helveticus]